MNYKCYWSTNGHEHAAILSNEESKSLYQNLIPILNLGLGTWLNIPTEALEGSMDEMELFNEYNQHIIHKEK